MKSISDLTIAPLSLKADTHSKTVYYDASCNLCNWSVRFISKYAGRSAFDFIPLQYSLEIDGEENKYSSIIFKDNASIYTKSDAVLHIAKYLKWPIYWLYGLIIIPRFLRNGVYMFVSKNRYKWFGECNCKQ